MNDPDEQRLKYQQSCEYRRKGKNIEQRTENGWKKGSQHPSINAAKRAVRDLGLRSYNAD